MIIRTIFYMLHLIVVYTIYFNIEKIYDIKVKCSGFIQHSQL